MARLLLVRHGKTEWNETGRYQGISDIGLSAEGMRQAEALRERLAGEEIDAIYCSDLKRAVQTARPIASGRELEIVLCKELREMNFGEFEGLTFAEIGERYPDNDWWAARDADMELPGGESISQLTARVDQFLTRLSQGNEAETVLVVAHGGTIRALICLVLGLGLEHWWQIGLDGASFTEINIYSERTVLSLLNDTCHLRNRESQEAPR